MSLRILLADESSTIKKAFEIGLNSYGVEIKNVQHGIDVLEVAEHFKPDIIFADVLISKMNGYDVCSQIKQHKDLGQTPVVLMWSGFMDIDEDKYFTSQADGKLEKPFSADQLMHLIQTLVQKPIGDRQSQSLESEKQTSADIPPPLSGLPQKQNLKVVPQTPRSTNLTDDLLLKADLESESKDLASLEEVNESEDFNLDEFQALDLHDTNGDTLPEDLNEITAIPSPEEERQLLQKLNEDTDIRHGTNLFDLDDNDEEHSGVSFDVNDLSDDFTDDLSDSYSGDTDSLTKSFKDLNPTHDLNDMFGEELNAENEDFKDLFSDESKPQQQAPNTIHRDVEDIHNSDMGVLSSTESLIEDEASDLKPSVTADPLQTDSSALVQQLSKEEIKKIIEEQAKDVIQSIVWELIPEISKQMIEKEIKRLLADTESNQL